MPGMAALDIDIARTTNPELIELKVDGSRGTYIDGELKSDRMINRNDRYSHIVAELAKVDWHIRGEIAIPSGNVLQLNKRDNWHKAKFYIFDLWRLGDMDTNTLSIADRRALIDETLKRYNFKNITAPLVFSCFDEGWSYVEDHHAEGLVLKGAATWKVKRLTEEKIKVVGHQAGKSKGSFLIERDGVVGKVSGTAQMYLEAYRRLVSQGVDAYAEIEYSFLTDDGKPYQPRLRRLGTLDSLSTT